MPTTPLKNLLYRAALPLAAPRPEPHLNATGEPLRTAPRLEHLLRRNHVLGGSLLLKDEARTARIDIDNARPPVQSAKPDTLYRVASITKLATAAVVLRLCDEGAFSLDDAVSDLLPGHPMEDALDGVTLRHLLSHTSGLRDTSACDRALQQGEDWHAVLADPAVRGSRPGACFAYCNFGFGLLGCVVAQVSGSGLDALYREKLFDPLAMTATLDGSTVDEARVMPIHRVLPYRGGAGVRVTSLGKRAIDVPDPLHQFGHTAGSLYTDAASLSHLLTMLSAGGVFAGRRVLSSAAVAEMTREHATYGKRSPTLSYGLGLLIIRDPALSSGRILGHQGFAYGCVDGAFWDESTGRQLISLNGGASEARTGRLGLCNRDLLRWALGKEMPSWK